jgi:hypothetical protein
VDTCAASLRKLKDSVPSRAWTAERDRMEVDRMAFLFVDDIVWTDGPGLSSNCCRMRLQVWRTPPAGCKYGIWGQGTFITVEGTVR